METTLLRIDEETKEKLRYLAKNERRSMNSLILSLIDQKIKESENAEAEGLF